MQAQQSSTEVKSKIETLRKKKEELTKQVSDLRIEKSNREKHYFDLKQIDQKHQSQEREYFQHQKQALESFLQSDFVKS